MDSEKGIWESEAALRRKSEKEMELKEKVEFLEAQEARYRRLADPWAHRSENMKCKSCMWFNPKRPQGPSPAHHVGPEVYDLGRCRRRAPTMNGYPAVFVNDWCGDHKIDETKVSQG